MAAEPGVGKKPSRYRAWLLGLLLVAATVLAYQPAWNAGFVWDDDDYVTANRLLSASDGLKRIWFSLDSPSQYFPLTYTVFRLEHSAWGLNSTGYHWVNVLLHSANALVLWRLLKRLQVRGSWLAAGLFALHPVHVESVAWVTELKNVLMLLFFLLALFAWTEFVERPQNKSWPFYFLSMFLFAMALFAKTTACTLPIVLLLVLWLKRKPITGARLIQTIPFFAFSLGMGFVTIWWERYHQGTHGKLFEMGVLERILVASRAVWFYLAKLVWPVNLTFIYPRWKVEAANPVDYLWFVAGAAVCAMIYFGRRRLGRSFEVALAFFVVTLAPVLGFIMLYTFRYSFVADHYQYVASIGPIALAAAGITTLCDSRWPGTRKVLFNAALLLTLGVLTWTQSGMYSNEETLWRTTIARNATCSIAYNNLGDILLKRGEVDEALNRFRKALELEPRSAETLASLSGALLQKGEVDETIARSREALEIDPKLAIGRYNLGAGLLQKGDLDEAITELQKASELQPDFAPTEIGLGNAFLQKGQLTEATNHYQRALRIDPDSADAHFNFGVALLQAGRLDEGLMECKRAVQLMPNNARLHYNLGLIMLKLNSREQAIAEFQEALRLRPDFAEAQQRLRVLEGR